MYFNFTAFATQQDNCINTFHTLRQRGGRSSDVLGEGEGGRGGGGGDVLQESIQQPETVCAMETHTFRHMYMLCNMDTLQELCIYNIIIYSGGLLKDSNSMVCGSVSWRTSCLQLHHKVFSLISFP